MDPPGGGGGGGGDDGSDDGSDDDELLDDELFIDGGDGDGDGDEDEDEDEDEEAFQGPMPQLVNGAEEEAAEDAYIGGHLELLQLLSHCLRGEATAALALADLHPGLNLVSERWQGGMLAGQGHIRVTWIDNNLNVWRDDTALILACQQGHIDLVRGLLLRKANAEAQTRYGWHPLMKAASNNHCEIMRILLGHGVNVDLAATSTMWTSLHIAADFNCREACELLVASGASIHSQNNQGNTPIQVYGRRASPRMSAADIETAQQALIAAFAAGPHPDARWARRRDLMMTLVGSGLRLMAAARAAEAAVQAALDKSVPLAPISRATPALNRDYLVREVLSQEGFVRQIAAFL